MNNLNKYHSFHAKGNGFILLNIYKSLRVEKLSWASVNFTLFRHLHNNMLL